MDYKTRRLFFFSPMESSSTFKNSLWREFWSTLRSKSSKDFLQLWFYLKCSYLFELASDQSLKLGKSPLCTVRWRRAVLRAQKERWYRTTGICWLLLLHWGGLCSSSPTACAVHGVCTSPMWLSPADLGAPCPLVQRTALPEIAEGFLMVQKSPGSLWPQCRTQVGITWYHPGTARLSLGKSSEAAALPSSN